MGSRFKRQMYFNIRHLVYRISKAKTSGASGERGGEAFEETTPACWRYY